MVMLFPWPAILYTGIFSTVFCLWAEVSFVVIRSAILLDEVVFVLLLILWNFSPFFFQVAAMRDVSATETAIIYGLEPVWGAAFAWAMLGERWGATGFVGAIFIIGKNVFTVLSVTLWIINFHSQYFSCLIVEDISNL